MLEIFDHLNEGLERENYKIEKIEEDDEFRLKLVAKELLDKLKKERLIFDWRKKQSTRAKVISTIEEVCDKLPDTYNPEIFKTKCDSLYVHLYDNYSNNQHRMSY